MERHGSRELKPVARGAFARDLSLEDVEGKAFRLELPRMDSP
jgi:hypothetical protein